MASATDGKRRNGIHCFEGNIEKLATFETLPEVDHRDLTIDLSRLNWPEPLRSTAWLEQR